MENDVIQIEVNGKTVFLRNGEIWLTSKDGWEIHVDYTPHELTHILEEYRKHFEK